MDDQRDYAEEAYNLATMNDEGASEFLGHPVSLVTEKEHTWKWLPYQQNGKSFVERFDVSQKYAKIDNQYELLGPFPNRTMAENIAGLLNDAYARGRAKEL